MKRKNFTPILYSFIKRGSLILATIFCIITSGLKAQTAYSYSISELLAAGPAGITLPDGTIAYAKKIVTGGGTYGNVSGDAHGEPGPEIGGTFTGVVLPGYTGSTNPLKFTKAVMSPTTNSDNGIGNNYSNAVGFHVYFSQPIANPQFLIVDIDGHVNAGDNNGNSEWAAAFAYNGTTFVPMPGSYLTAGPPAPEITTGSATIAAGHSWNVMRNNEIPGSSALPSTYPIYRQNNTNDGEADPDNIQNQILVSSASSITDFFFLTGIYQTVGQGGNTQRSGVSPITVVVTPDFGDAPDSYGTLLASNGASHGVFANLKLGASENTEADGLPSSLANNSTDDDGVATVPAIINNGTASQVISSYSLTTSYTNNLAATANVIAWIDWNNNGTFEEGEAQSTIVAANTSGNVTFTWTNVTLSSSSEGDAQTYARIRITTGNMTTANPTGAYKDGEVEDYRIPFILSISLPLHLTSFTGVAEGHNVRLNWHAEDQVNVKEFSVERSYDGLLFTSIATQPAYPTISDYTYTDNKINSSVVFYRLKIIDNDGQFEYSKSIKLNIENKITISITPNPVVNNLTINIELAVKSQLRIISMNGATILTKNLPAQNNHTISLGELSRGAFILQLLNEQGKIIANKKIIKN